MDVKESKKKRTMKRNMA